MQAFTLQKLKFVPDDIRNSIQAILNRFLHTHPYSPYLYKGVRKVIVGTLPPPRFTLGDLRPGDVDFCYGSRDGLLWPVLDRIFDLGLAYETTQVAVSQRQNFLRSRNIGICDIVESAERVKVDASDLGMENIKTRDLIKFLSEYNQIDTLLFTGGNSKNGPEFLFRRLLKSYGLSLDQVSQGIPRIHRFKMPANDGPQRVVRTISLTAPSGSANRAIGSMQVYKDRKEQAPNYNTLEYRVDQYREFF